MFENEFICLFIRSSALRFFRRKNIEAARRIFGIRREGARKLTVGIQRCQLFFLTFLLRAVDSCFYKIYQ